MHADVAEGAVSPAEILTRAGFVGCGNAVPSLSSDYKSHLAQSLARKA